MESTREAKELLAVQPRATLASGLSVELIWTGEFLKRLTLKEMVRFTQFQHFESAEVQINSKLSVKNRVVTY